MKQEELPALPNQNDQESSQGQKGQQNTAQLQCFDVSVK
jgi:hypothetical protein